MFAVKEYLVFEQVVSVESVNIVLYLSGPPVEMFVGGKKAAESRICSTFVTMGIFWDLSSLDCEHFLSTPKPS